MVEKPIVSLRVYKGKSVNYDENGKIKNENQLIKVFYNTVEWSNQLKHLKSNGYIKVDVENAKIVKNGKVISDYKDIDVIKLEVKKAFDVSEEKKLTPEQKKIAELEAKLNSFMSKGVKKDDEDPHKKLMRELKSEYRELYGKGGSPKWDEATLREKIAEKKKETE